MRTTERGFTLLEVMVAVAVLGIVVTLITRASVQGMQYASDARNRLTASLLADRLLVELETQVDAGLPPRVGTEEHEEGPFRTAVAVSAFDPASVGLDALLSADGDERSRALPAVFQATRDGGAPLLTADIRVSWTDGIHEQEVSRTTFLFLPETLPALAQLAEAAAAEGAVRRDVRDGEDDGSPEQAP